MGYTEYAVEILDVHRQSYLVIATSKEDAYRRALENEGTPVDDPEFVRHLDEPGDFRAANVDEVKLDLDILIRRVTMFAKLIGIAITEDQDGDDFRVLYRRYARDPHTGEIGDQVNDNPYGWHLSATREQLWSDVVARFVTDLQIDRSLFSTMVTDGEFKQTLDAAKRLGMHMIATTNPDHR